jgi:Domain of unknown function (DUF4268)
MSYPIGQSACDLSAVMLSQRNRVRAELYLSGNYAKPLFGVLARQEEAVEQELGFPLQWEELPDGQHCRICVYLDATNPKAADDWKRQHEWLAEKLDASYRVFSRRVRKLGPDD